MPQTFHSAFGAWILAGSLLLGGCADPGALRPAAASQLAGRATLVLDPQVLAATSRGTQAVVPRLTLESVHHVRVQLTRLVPGGEEAVRDADGPLALRIERSQLDRPVVLSRLHPDTHYRVRAWAYRALDEVDSNLISLASLIDVVVGSDDRPTVAPLRIQLQDVPFNGRATLPSFDFRPGGFVPDGEESVAFAPLEWVQAGLLTWMAPEGDRMGRVAAEPDGLQDAHFRLALDLPDTVTIREIALYQLRPDGYWDATRSWTTKDYDDPDLRLLGVASEGLMLNGDFAPRLGTYSGPVTFDLYAHHDGEFPPGETYSYSVVLSDATILWGDLTIPAQEVSSHD